ADAPKPSTYPFNSINVKERGHKTNNTPDIRAYLPSYIQIFCAAVSGCFPFPSVCIAASVRLR
ncbi:MAG: hypothetical protein ACOH2M_12135, partial [Cypionkella sp.]